MQPTIDSGVCHGRCERAARRAAPRHARSVVVGAHRLRAELLLEEVDRRRGAQSQGVGSRVPVQSNSCNQSAFVTPHEITAGWSPSRRCGAAHSTPQPRGAKAHLCRLAAYQSTPSASMSEVDRARRVRAVDEHGDAVRAARGGEIERPAGRARSRRSRGRARPGACAARARARAMSTQRSGSSIGDRPGHGLDDRAALGGEEERRRAPRRRRHGR